MKRDMLDDDFMDKEIENFLASYVVQKCDDRRMDETINVLKDYMPKPKEKYPLLKMIKNEISYIDKIYVVAALILIILGRYVTLNDKISPYNIMMASSPIPVIIGLYEITKNKRNNMWELERSMKYSYSLISLARIILVIGISCIFNMMFSAGLCKISINTNIFKCMAAWIVPMSIIFSVELFIFNLSRDVYIPICISCSWIVALVVFDKSIIDFLEYSSNGLLIFVMSVSVFMFFISIYRFYEREKDYEGEVVWS